jgi:hypothetical protein
VDVLEFRPLLVGSGSTASAGRSSSRLVPAGAGRLPDSPSISRASAMAVSALTGSRGANLGSAGLAGTQLVRRENAVDSRETYWNLLDQCDWMPKTRVVVGNCLFVLHSVGPEKIEGVLCSGLGSQLHVGYC